LAGIALVFTLQAGAQAQTFPVSLQVSTDTACSFQASLMSIDPTTGAITLNVPTATGCGAGYPASVLTLESQAAVSLSAVTAVDGTSVQVTLATGFNGPTAGVTCSPDGVTANGATVTAGWTDPLCVNCGASASRSVTTGLTASTSGGTLLFKVKCVLAGDAAHPNIQTSVGLQSSLLAVTPSPIPAECTSVSQMADSRGLTPAMRQTIAPVKITPSGSYVSRDVSLYTSIFGISLDVATPGASDPTSYGFPGTNKTVNYFMVNRNSYISMRFRVPSNGTWLGRNGSFLLPATALPMAFVVAPCPGQFSSDATWPLSSNGCVASTENPLNWEITTGSTSKCKLVPGANYYLNIITAPASNPANSICNSSVCTHGVTPDHLY
jgi:hypothetical protein